MTDQVRRASPHRHGRPYASPRSRSHRAWVNRRSTLQDCSCHHAPCVHRQRCRQGPERLTGRHCPSSAGGCPFVWTTMSVGSEVSSIPCVGGQARGVLDEGRGPAGCRRLREPGRDGDRHRRVAAAYRRARLDRSPHSAARLRAVGAGRLDPRRGPGRRSVTTSRCLPPRTPLTSARLHAEAPRGYEEDPGVDAKVYEGLHNAAAFERASEFDVVSNQFDFMPLTYSRCVHAGGDHRSRLLVRADPAGLPSL